MTFYEIRSFKIKSLRRPYGYLARAYINGVYVEQYYEWKPARQQALEDLTTRYDFNNFAAQTIQRNRRASILGGKI